MVIARVDFVVGNFGAGVGGSCVVGDLRGGEMLTIIVGVVICLLVLALVDILWHWKSVESDEVLEQRLEEIREQARREVEDERRG